MRTHPRSLVAAFATVGMLLVAAASAPSQNQIDQAAADTEVRKGQNGPLDGEIEGDVEPVTPAPDAPRRCVKYQGSGLGSLTGEARCLEYEQ